jgi:hypothetical protein
MSCTRWAAREWVGGGGHGWGWGASGTWCITRWAGRGTGRHVGRGGPLSVPARVTPQPSPDPTLCPPSQPSAAAAGCRRATVPTRPAATSRPTSTGQMPCSCASTTGPIMLCCTPTGDGGAGGGQGSAARPRLLRCALLRAGARGCGAWGWGGCRAAAGQLLRVGRKVQAGLARSQVSSEGGYTPQRLAVPGRVHCEPQRLVVPGISCQATPARPPPPAGQLPSSRWACSWMPSPTAALPSTWMTATARHCR